MSSFAHLQVYQTMSRSPNARLELSAELGEGLSAALWSNSHDTRDYQTPNHHTLSCYLAGGTGTFRRERPGTKGAPGKLCILPAEHQSAWVINGEVRLAHLYVSRERFALAVVGLLDREPRTLQLQEATFLDDPEQARRFSQLTQLNWHEPGERLLTSSLAQAMLDHAVLSQVGLREGLRLRGGLAPTQCRRLRDYIEAHLSESISLQQLAQRVALSEYHFARMFRESFGVPPHRYLLARRLARARQLLANGQLPLGDVALACGFGSASHFSNRFRQALGATPGQYRQALGR